MCEFAPQNLSEYSVINSQCLKAVRSDSYKAVPADTGVSWDCLKRPIIISVKA